MLKGCIVTIDAIGCQTESVQKIIDRGGDYLLAVKDNLGTLADARLAQIRPDLAASGYAVPQAQLA